MVAKLGDAELIKEDDLLKRLLRDYGVEADDEKTRSSFVQHHLDILEASGNEVVSRTGYVLKRAQDGFGLGYRVPLAVVAIGRTMLGIDIAVAAPFIASNPAAFTCAAIGAVYYGLSALTESERADLTDRVATSFGFGVELVKTLAQFCVEQLKSVLDADLLKSLKKCVAEVASQVGTSVYEITGSLTDRLVSAAATAVDGASRLVGSAGYMVSSAAAGVSDYRKRLSDREGNETSE